MRVAVVTNLPRPYRHALFNEVARQLGADSDLIVIYCSEQSQHPRRREVQADYGDALYTAVRASPRRLTARGERVRSVAAGIPGILRALHLDAAVVAGFSLDAILAHLACWRHRIPVVVWSGAWPGGEQPVSPLQRQLRKHVAAHTASMVAYGTLARDYFVSLGADRANGAVAVNTVDVERFSALAEESRSSSASAAARYHLSEKNILYVGSLVERKGAPELLEAYARMAMPAGHCTLHLVGTGSLMSELQLRAAGLAPHKRVRFHGFLQEDEVARLAGLCDLFVCPSRRELWGLVINEAMACGLPVVASRLAGATPDLIDDGVNGYVVDPTQPDEIAEKLELLLADPRLAHEMGRRAALSVREKASLDRSARGFIQGIEIALADSGRPCRGPSC